MEIKTEIEVRFPDCDTMGIVHHAVYPIWYEMGRMDFFKTCGFGYSESRKLGIDPAMVNLNLNYGRAVSYPDTVFLYTKLTTLQGKKIGFSYEVKDKDDNLIASATSFHIWVRGGKSLNIEDEVPEMFAAYKKALEA